MKKKNKKKTSERFSQWVLSRIEFRIFGAPQLKCNHRDHGNDRYLMHSIYDFLRYLWIFMPDHIRPCSVHCRLIQTKWNIYRNNKKYMALFQGFWRYDVRHLVKCLHEKNPFIFSYKMEIPAYFIIIRRTTELVFWNYSQILKTTFLWFRTIKKCKKIFFPKLLRVWNRYVYIRVAEVFIL